MTIDFPVRFSYRQRTSQVRSAMQELGDICWGPNAAYDCIFRASRTRIAFRRFPPESCIIFPPASGGRSKPARFDTYWRTVIICFNQKLNFHDNQNVDKSTSSSLGAATRIRRHRLLIGAMSRLVLLAHRIIRKLVIYFSIVLRRAAWASRDRESASFIMTTDRKKSITRM